MKTFLKTICIISAFCIILSLCGCENLNKKPTTLADSISIPDGGLITAELLAELKEENKAVKFVGMTGDIKYEWVVFGADVTDRDINLAIEITEAGEDRVEFKFVSDTDFGFTPALSIYLGELWNAQSASLQQDGVTVQKVSVSGKKQTVLTFAPKTQIGTWTIVPDAEYTETSSADVSEDVSFVTSLDDAVSYETSQEESNAEVSDSRLISNGEASGQDIYHTDPVPEGKPLPVEPDDKEIDRKKEYTCVFSIECTTILNHLNELEEEKLDVLPSDGIIFAPQEVAFYEGESVFDVLQRICRENKIHLESSFTPMYNSAYVEGINNLYEFDCGSGSGWMYRVDGWYPNYGCSRYQLKDGERVEWRFTCDLGSDIGGGYAVGGE